MRRLPDTASAKTTIESSVLSSPFPPPSSLHHHRLPSGHSLRKPAGGELLSDGVHRLVLIRPRSTALSISIAELYPRILSSSLYSRLEDLFFSTAFLSSSAAMDPQSNLGADSAVASPGTIGCCSTVQSFIPPDLISYPSSHSGLVNATISPYGPQVPEFPPAFQHFPYPKDGQDYAELQQDSNWEAQLEGILMSMLDGVYKDAVKKIISSNFTQEEALSAVLRKGRWNKRDALTSIGDSALAWLQNSEARSSTTDLVFSDLKEMESYVLAEMVSMLRKVRPYMSKGDAMWCLLMCDLNVLLACTMDEDSVPLASKEGHPSSVVLSQTKQPTELPPSSAPPTSTMTTVLPPQQAPYLPQANAQPTSILISSHKESRSAFSTPSFSSSPVGKVAIASRKASSSKPSVSIGAQKSTASLTVEAINAQKPITCLNLNSMHEQAHQNLGSAKNHQISVPQLTAPEDHAMKLGLYISNSNIGLEKCRNLKPEHLVQRAISMDASPNYPRETQTAVLSVQCMPQRSDILAKNFGVEQLTSFQPGATGSKLKGNKIHCSTVVLPDDSRQSVLTDLQIGSSSGCPSYHLPQDEGWTTSSSSCTVGNLASSGAELSLATASIMSNASTEFSGDCLVDSCTDENHISCSKAGISVGQMLGCTDSSAEERKTVMLWQLVDRVKYLEAQLQDWTDWAQQKVMQAARRLTKDTAELKALRQERDEYMRLKKEKQALEESTMKKLAEMETSLGKALSQVERANTTAGRLESENAQVRKEMEAAKLTAAESVYVCQEATKREKKSIKKAQGWEKQKVKLQEELIEGKRNLSNLLEQLAQARERLQQAEVRWRQEKKAKEEAQLAAETEKRAKESAEHSAKKREEALQRKSEALSQRYREEVQKLDSEIGKIKLSMGLQPSALSWGNSYKMTSTNLDTCSAEKLKQINGRTPIQQRIRVYGVRP
ncbi:hypothetical protein GOP47_0013218 [Adiantum capillus-veneris]|uniref:PIR2-like helical domain-containing protein n=1 Tax=Adiantum capillus-veneris TaxID=13818 RepID=A0A9D4UNM2_ADICA|nr:hypothetical protein GOP47_0013218 [Adiantum capillus-veneris]